MKTWINQFELLLKKHFYDDEVEEIISYYQEMIEERVAKGELIDDVLASYDVKAIIKEITPDMIKKRDLGSYKILSKSTKQIMLLLLSTPILIPIGVLYIALIVTAFSFLIAGIAIGFSSIFGLVIYVIDLISSDLSFIHKLGILGIGIVSFSILLLLSLYMIKWVSWMSKVLLDFFIKVLNRGESQHEKN
ncbi:MAG: hypothetical protein RBT45_04160 [Acholeplasmataceae bacterium]|jgi:uncharacterized membrane protein|nr:hypothetical protein [Acholeplasmataceae bacterium]